VHYYELHEGDDDTFADLVLAREEPMEADEFFTLVQGIRRRVQDSFETETLIEAIAEELELHHGFTYISDDRLTAAVNVSTTETENFLSDLSADADEEAEEDEEDEQAAEYRTILADLDARRQERN
jgi:hypothetical protein